MKNTFLIVVLIFCLSATYAQKDTLRISLSEAEKRFQSANLTLLAQKYQIDADKAQIIQARLFPNPTLSISQSPTDFSHNGETAIGISQLIHLAGQRNKNIALSKLNAQLSENAFYELLRTLKYELRSDLIDLYFFKQNVKVYDKQINTLQGLIKVYEEQYKKGNISLVETTRLKAEIFGMNSDKLELINQITDKESDIRLLIGDTLASPIEVQIDTNQIRRDLPKNLILSQLFKTAYDNRYDLKSAQTQIELQQTNYSLQKSLQVPDLQIGASWDKNGGYIKNCYLVNFAFDIPLWNRNKGNIQTAKYQTEQSKVQLLSLQRKVNEDLISAYQKLINTDKAYQNIDNQFTTDFNKLIDGILLNYEKKNISLIEFLDYYETYRQSYFQLNKLKESRLDAMEELNYDLGKDLF